MMPRALETPLAPQLTTPAHFSSSTTSTTASYIAMLNVDSNQTMLHVDAMLNVDRASQSNSQSLRKG